MADFDPPFGTDSDRRFPNATEAQQGHPCGDADRALFNGLQYRVEAEIGNVISFAGIPMTDDRMTQLREAIQALIASAIPIETPVLDYLLMSQARGRLLFFPETQTTDGIIPMTVSTGQVVVPTGYTVLHRGIYPMTTGAVASGGRTFATTASKIYHLRAAMTASEMVFSLNDLANATYNPSALPDTHTNFDSTFDNALLARIVTNSSNVPVATNLVNKDRYVLEIESTIPRGSVANAGYDDAYGQASMTWALARTPSVSWDMRNLDTQAAQQPGYLFDQDMQFSYFVGPSRYGASWQFRRDYEVGPITLNFKVRM